MDKSTYERIISQSLQTNNKQFKITITFLSAYIGIFNVTNRNKKFYFMKSITDEGGFFQITIPPGAYEIKSLTDEIKRNIIDEEHYTESNSPFTIKANFLTLVSIIEKSPQGPTISVMFDDSIKDPLGFHAITLYEEYNLSTIPVDILDILLFDNIFLE